MRELARIAIRQRHLLAELARREVSGRYADQLLGGFWAIINPILLLVIYVVVFTVIFPSRGPSNTGNVSDGVVFLLSGLVPWLATAEVLSRSPSVLSNHAALVKQIVFPVEVLPLKSLALPAFNLLLLLTLVLIYSFLARGGLPPGVVVLLPLALALHGAIAVGLSFGLAACGPFIRDLREVMVFVTAAGLFLAPILYTESHIKMFPWALQAVLYANPFSYLIWCYQDAVYFGSMEHPMSWIVTSIFGAVSAVAGYTMFRKLKPVFGDSL